MGDGAAHALQEDHRNVLPRPLLVQSHGGGVILRRAGDGGGQPQGGERLLQALRQLRRGHPQAYTQPGGGAHAGGHRRAVAPLGVVPRQLVGVAQRVAEVEEHPLPRVPLVLFHYAPFNRAAGIQDVFHFRHQLRPGGPGRQEVEEGRVPDAAVFDHLRHALHEHRQRQGVQHLRVHEHQPGLPEGPRQILSVLQIHGHLAPYGGIHLGQQGGGDLHEVHPPQDGGGGEPRQIPIIQSTTFKYATSEDMGKLFDLEADGYFYSRLQNPTCDMVAKKICELEGGTAAMLTSSGQAANFFALFNLCEAGDHIVASSTIYGGTFNLISVTMKKMGITATFVDPLCSEEELDAAFQPNTKVVFGETIANPALTVLDIEKFAKAAHAHGVPLIVDNTFPTPVNCRPFEWGADIVTHSTTKYMDGHGAVLGGAIVDSGKFDWMAHAEKFPGLCTPDESYHGITYAERFGKEGAFITKATAQLMRDFGSMQSPMNAYMLNLGLESLHVRMQRHCANGMAVAKFLEAHPKVAYVNYCGLESSPYHALAEKYLPNGSCGVVSFGLAGGREAASTFMKELKLAAIETHVADARTCCLNPASSTHRQMNDEQLAAAGVPAELVRMSCGLESSEDLIADIAQALDQI